MERSSFPPGRIIRPVRRMGVRRRISISRKHRNAARFWGRTACAAVDLDPQFAGEVVGRDAGEHVRLVSGPDPGRHAIHLAMRPGFGEDALLRPPAPWKATTSRGSVRFLVATALNSQPYSTGRNRSNWIGCLCWCLTRFPTGMKRWRAFHDFGFQRVSKRSVPSAGRHHRFSPSIKLLRARKCSKGTEMVNSAPDECSCWTTVSSRKALSMRVSIFAWGRRGRTWLIRWPMKVSAPLESRTFPGRWRTSGTWSVRTMVRKRGWQLRAPFLFLLKPVAVPSAWRPVPAPTRRNRASPSKTPRVPRAP